MRKQTRDERYERINEFRIENDDMPDGAFFALSAEQGISVDDWAWFADEHERRERHVKPEKVGKK